MFLRSICLQAVFFAITALGQAAAGPEAVPAEPDALQDFKAWLKEYRRGGIDLYQRSIVPLTSGGQGAGGRQDRSNIEIMDALMEEAAATGTVEAARLLVEAATFRFDRRGDVEAEKYFRQQPWVMRSHAGDALTRVRGAEARDWLRINLLESRSVSDAAYRRALGTRIFGGDADDLSRILPSIGDRDADVRETALRELARCGSADHIEAAFGRLQDESEEVRCAAIEAVSGIVERTRDAKPEIFFESLDRILALLEDPSWSVQDAVLAYLERFRAVKTIPALIDFLARQQALLSADAGGRARTLHRTVEVLQSLTAVTSPGVDPALWNQWWTENQDFFELPPETAMREGYQTGTAQFFSIPVHSDRVAFILDISGSMKGTLSSGTDEPGESKLERARRELERTLERLDSSVRFNILLFNDQVARFSGVFEPAHIANVLQAKVFFRKIDADGGTNLFDALNEALSLRELGVADRIGDEVECDTVFLLSDGVPSAGLVVDPNEILEIITRANRSRRIRIHTIYLGAEPSLFMQELAARNHGRYVHLK